MPKVGCCLGGSIIRYVSLLLDEVHLEILENFQLPMVLFCASLLLLVCLLALPIRQFCVNIIQTSLRTGPVSLVFLHLVLPYLEQHRDPVQGLLTVYFAKLLCTLVVPSGACNQNSCSCCRKNCRRPFKL